MQESRLFRIVYELLDRGKSTAPELAEKFEVSVRTIYRDIDAISSAGIPIYASRGKGGGISLLDHFVLDKSLLTSWEKERIMMALQGVAAAEGSDSGELITKLGSLFQSKNTNWIEVDFSGWIKNNPGPDLFNSIKNAVFNRNVIAFHYFGGGGSRTWRRVEPVRLTFKSKDWYLYGYCLLRSGYRFFKLTRIRDLRILPEVYAPGQLPEPPSAPVGMEAEDTVNVKLKFDRKLAFRVYDEFADEAVETERGDLLVQTNLPGGDMLFSYLFSFADGVEVLEPESVRKSVKEKLSAMQKRYET